VLPKSGVDPPRSDIVDDVHALASVFGIAFFCDHTRRTARVVIVVVVVVVAHYSNLSMGLSARRRMIFVLTERP